jgi:hypothetical protein
MSRRKRQHRWFWGFLGVAGVGAIAMSGARLSSQEALDASRLIDRRPLVRADIADPPILSFEEGQAGVSERVRQMQARRAARMARQRREVRDYTVGDPPPALGLPPRPDAPGGSLSAARRGGGR